MQKPRFLAKLSIFMLTTGVLAFVLIVSGRLSSGTPLSAQPKEAASEQKRDVYYPGTEKLASDEMRVIACGTGMPQPRSKQAAACFLVELGNGDKFIFDIGAGSAERLAALGIPMDDLDKVFIGHLHLDHAGDFPQFYFTGPVNNRLAMLRLWGPSGVKAEWGTKAWVQKMREMWGWEEATRRAVADARGMRLEVNEVDWTKINQVIYDEKGVKVRSIPAVHGDQSMSFILEWKGLQFAFSSDTLPNKWWVEHTKGVDLAVHECFLPPELMVKKYGMAPGEAINVGTQGHTAAVGFGKVMAQTKPRLAVAYHFQNDFDTAPAVRDAIRKYYDGPLDLATDFMVWNVTKKEIRTRMAVVNHEAYPVPTMKERKAPDSFKTYQPTELTLSGVDRESAIAINKLIGDFNQKNGTNIKPSMTGLPFKNDKK